MIATVWLVVQKAPFAMVHLNTYDPYALTVAVAPGAFALGANATVPGPLTNVHVPVPTAGVFPASVATNVLQRFCAGPALAARS